MGLLLFYLLIAIGVSFFCSIAEAVLLSTRPSYIVALQQKKKASGKILHELKENMDRPLAAILCRDEMSSIIPEAPAESVGREMGRGKHLGERGRQRVDHVRLPHLRDDGCADDLPIAVLPVVEHHPQPMAHVGDARQDGTRRCDIVDVTVRYLDDFVVDSLVRCCDVVHRVELGDARARARHPQRL